jgi:hypothetical protein
MVITENSYRAGIKRNLARYQKEENISAWQDSRVKEEIEKLVTGFEGIESALERIAKSNGNEFLLEEIELLKDAHLGYLQVEKRSLETTGVYDRIMVLSRIQVAYAFYNTFKELIRKHNPKTL